MHLAQAVKDHLLQDVLSLELGQRNHDKSLGIPCIHDWELHSEKENLYILGKVTFHPRHTDGSNIRTSAILSHRRLQNRLTVMTQNSVYELGTPSDTQINNETSDMNQFASQSYQPLPDPWDLPDEDNQDYTIEL